MKLMTCLASLLLSASLASAATDLVSNVQLEAKNSAGNGPAEWGTGGAVRWMADEKGNHFLRIASTAPGKMDMIYREFDLPAGTKKMSVSFRARVTGLRAGDQPWFDARLIHKLRTPQGDRDAPPVVMNHDTAGWEKKETVFDVPDGATKYIFMPSLFQAKAGVLDLDDIRITALGEGEEVPSTLPPARPLPTCELKPLTAADMPVVDGPQLKTQDGRDLWLQGLSIPSLEWLASGEHIEESFAYAICDWKANVIRLPLKHHYWFDTTTEPFNKRNDGGKRYRELVDKLVDYANERGCYVVLDLHCFKAPTEEHVAFWRDCAKRYANRPGVLFDLFNEPHGISWNEWLNGGELKDGGSATAKVETTESQDVDRSVGIQALIDAVRATGAKNVVLVGGLDWAYDDSGVLNGFEPKDANGNGIVYATHVYPWKSGWQKAFLDVAAKHPVLLGEVGANNTKMEFEDKLVDPYPWTTDVISCIQKYKLHWTGWCFHPSASPCILADWDYTPTPYWGAFVRAALRGAQFTSDTLR